MIFSANIVNPQASEAYHEIISQLTSDKWMQKMDFHIISILSNDITGTGLSIMAL